MICRRPGIGPSWKARSTTACSCRCCHCALRCPSLRPRCARRRRSIAGGDAVGEGRTFIDAAHSLSDRRLAFVASCNTGAGLSPRAPLTEVSWAVELEERLAGDLERGALFRDLAIEVGCAGSCAAGTLAAFAAAFGGSQNQVRAHDAPFGVGYLVASAGA